MKDVFQRWTKRENKINHPTKKTPRKQKADKQRSLVPVSPIVAVANRQKTKSCLNDAIMKVLSP